MFLGIDVGTSGVKTVVINSRSDVIEHATAPLNVSRPKPLWSEQSPDDWWAATQAAVMSLSPDRRAGIEAIGLSGQMHGATLLGRDDRPLRPAILWNDGRSHAECADLEQIEPRSRQISANLAMPGFTAPKLIWVRKNEPLVFGQTVRVLLPKDYIRLVMSGEHASDMSDSAGTMWLDVEAREWSDPMLAACGLDTRHMPKLFEGPDITGTLRVSLAADWGMKPVPIVAGGGDNAAGAVGVGVISPGEAFLSLGTSGVLFIAGDANHPDPEAGVHAFCHALPGRWHQMSVMLAAASSLDWAARLAGLPGGSELAAAAERRNRLDGAEVFLPYLSGERTPHNNPHARGVLFGLSHDSDAAAIGQAVLEGVAFAFADGLDALVHAGGKLDSITVIGGGARSRYWGRILAAALGKPLVYRRDGDVGPAYGAAKLAQLGLMGDTIERVCAAPPELARIEPNPADMDRLAGKRDRFRNLYSNLKPLFVQGA